MYRLNKGWMVALCALWLLALPGLADAQRRNPPRHPQHPRPAPVVRGYVFIGGYFYDPAFGRYPWWRQDVYPYWYYPVYDHRAELRLHVAPEEAEQAAVYVDGYYAGVVDDFNGVFQGLPLTPGGHRIVLYLEGYRTVRHNIYLQPGSSFRLRQTMEKLPAGIPSERPETALPLPAPPDGTYRTPVTPPRAATAVAGAEAATPTGYGVLDLFIRPSDAQVKIDGQVWVSSEAGHFIIQVGAGRHHIEVTRSGYRPFATELDVVEGQTTPLNVSLAVGTE